MTVLPFVVTTSRPSIMMFTGSIIEDWSNGMLECWTIVPRPSLHYSRTPSLHSHRAALFRNVRFKLVAVFLDKRRRRHGRRIAERTNRIPHDIATDVENQIEIALLARAVLDAAKNLFHPVTAFAARAALAAGLVGEKPSEVPRGVDHTRGIVHDDHSAGAEQASRRLDGLVIEIHLFDLLGAQHRHRSATRNDTLEFSAVGNSAAVFIEKLFEWIAHFHFVDTGLSYVTTDAEKFSPLALLRAHGRISRRPMFDNPGQRCQCLNIVDHRRTAEQAMGRRKRRLDLWPTSAAFQRRQQRCFFTADIGARASVNDHVQVVSRSENILADITGFNGFINGLFEPAGTESELTANIDKGGGWLDGGGSGARALAGRRAVF